MYRLFTIDPVDQADAIAIRGTCSQEEARRIIEAYNAEPHCHRVLFAEPVGGDCDGRDIGATVDDLVDWQRPLWAQLTDGNPYAILARVASGGR